MSSIISSEQESYKVISYYDDMANAGITDNASLSGSLKYANLTVNQTTYYLILQKEIGENEYKNLFVSDQADFFLLQEIRFLR
ncbi:hypothetical protein GOV05_03655 [Candidatus Woesearchaeota archaeon]|nr:hypothetical protein [Candidatus Woesearchaeota archaeon]